MTHREKIESLKDVISSLYEDNGLSINKISKYLLVDRKILTQKIKEWGFTQQTKAPRITSSVQKFINKNKDYIISQLNADRNWTDIARELNVPKDFLRTLKADDKDICEAVENKENRKHLIVTERKAEREIHDLEGEKWKEILGYPRYMVSNMGRVKAHIKRYNIYVELQPYQNPLSGRLYITLYNNNEHKTYQLARLVASVWCPGKSDINNTVNHKNGIVNDNRADNLEWVSQSENNKHAYSQLHRKANVAYMTNGKFSEIVLDNKYHFKTIRALAKFLGKSESQTHRYISGETKTNHTFTFIRS